MVGCLTKLFQVEVLARAIWALGVYCARPCEHRVSVTKESGGTSLELDKGTTKIDAPQARDTPVTGEHTPSGILDMSPGISAALPYLPVQK